MNLTSISDRKVRRKPEFLLSVSHQIFHQSRKKINALLAYVGYIATIIVGFHMTVVQTAQSYFEDFVPTDWNDGFRLDVYGPISFKLGMFVVTIWHIIWHRKITKSRESQNFCESLLRKISEKKSCRRMAIMDRFSTCCSRFAIFQLRARYRTSGGPNTHLATSRAETLRAIPEEREPLVDAGDWRCQMQDMLFSTEVPGATTKNSQQDTARKASTVEMLDQDYSTSLWTHVCTDGSFDAAVRKSGSGVHARLAMAKHFEGRWLRVLCQATTGSNSLLCMKLPDFSAQRHHPCPTSSSLQTVYLLSKAYSRWRDIRRLLCDRRNTARSLSSGSLLTLGWQETRRWIVLPSLAASKSSPTW